MAFPAPWLAHPGPVANRLLHQHLEKQAAEWHSQQTGSGLQGEVRRLVQGTIANDRCSADRVSQLLGMTARTLNRRLGSDGTTFKALRDAVLYDMAQQLLRTTSLDINAVARLLGYAEASSFIHAFTRWSGRTPQHWRRGIVRGHGDGVDPTAAPV